MCTLIVLRRPEHPWPLWVAANRDEIFDRPWASPGRHWEDRPEVIAGLDETGGGSWFGINDNGLVAAVTNREGTLGPAKGRRTRGELALEALDHAEASEAAQALSELDPVAFRSFNLFIGDPVSAYWLRLQGHNKADSVEVFEIPPGLHMLTAQDLNDYAVPRIRVNLPRFQQATAPGDPLSETWHEWADLLGSRWCPDDEPPQAVMNLPPEGGFGTVCSQLAAIPRYPGFEQRPVFWFADGLADPTMFKRVSE